MKVSPVLKDKNTIKVLSKLDLWHDTWDKASMKSNPAQNVYAKFEYTEESLVKKNLTLT